MSIRLTLSAFRVIRRPFSQPHPKQSPAASGQPPILLTTATIAWYRIPRTPPTCSVPQLRGTEPSKAPQRDSVPYHARPQATETPESQHPPKTQRPVVRYGTPKTPFPAFCTTTAWYGTRQSPSKSFRTIPHPTVHSRQAFFARSRFVHLPRRPVDAPHAMHQLHVAQICGDNVRVNSEVLTSRS